MDNHQNENTGKSETSVQVYCVRCQHLADIIKFFDDGSYRVHCFHCNASYLTVKQE